MMLTLRQGVARALGNEIGLSLLQRAVCYRLGQALAVGQIRRLGYLDRRAATRKLMQLLRVDRHADFLNVLRRRATMAGDPADTEIYELASAFSTGVTGAQLDPAPGLDTPEVAGVPNRVYARSIAAYDGADYRGAVDAFCRLRTHEPADLRIRYDYLKAAYAAGLLRRLDLAAELFAGQYVDDFTDTRDDLRYLLDSRIFHDVISAISTELLKPKYFGASRRIGIFFLSSTEALGHAILDPYYFLALHRSRFDHVIFIGPSRRAYRPASAACLKIVEQYGRYIETSSDLLLNLSWMNLGQRAMDPFELIVERFQTVDVGYGRQFTRSVNSHGKIELVIEHYWSLLRSAVHRTRDPDDGFRHNDWKMTLPEEFVEAGEAFSRRHGLDLDKPIVVLHAREQLYHRIEKQSYRNANIAHYDAAVRFLLEHGYQVVRIGDAAMVRLAIDRAGYYELPFLDGYDSRLDSFFVSRSHFMIGCQSGPCAYARVLGIPLLSVNAVLHYTLLPAKMEMACFKRYYVKVGGTHRELSLGEALDLGVHHFDNSFQFQRAGISLEDASSDEILAAVQDMIAWIARPDLAETELQFRFRRIVEQKTRELEQRGSDLPLPIGDFLGIALEGYRIAPTVAAMRAGSADGPA